MTKKQKELKEQMKFCEELMDRLSKLLADNFVGDSWGWGIRNRSQISNDIVRLRRELSTLNKLMYPYD